MEQSGVLAGPITLRSCGSNPTLAIYIKNEMEKTEDLKKESDAIMIECDEEVIDENSLVSISPFNTKTKEWLVNDKKMILLKEAEKIKKKQIVKGNNLIKY